MFDDLKRKLQGHYNPSSQTIGRRMAFLQLQVLLAKVQYSSDAPPNIRPYLAYLITVHTVPQVIAHDQYF